MRRERLENVANYMHKIKQTGKLARYNELLHIQVHDTCINFAFCYNNISFAGGKKWKKELCTSTNYYGVIHLK